jgi:hypothetical protein
MGAIIYETALVALVDSNVHVGSKGLREEGLEYSVMVFYGSVNR